jgi:hypothetical protein
MPISVKVSVASPAKPDSVWSVLAARLGRDPTDPEVCAEVRRILMEPEEPRHPTGGTGASRRVISARFRP